MGFQRELQPDILEYFRSRPYVLFSPLDNHRSWSPRYALFRKLRNPSISGPWIELVYAVIYCFGDVVLHLIEHGVAFQAVWEVLSLPTALSWLSLLCSDIMMKNIDFYAGCPIELDRFLQGVLNQGVTAKLDSSEQDVLAILLPFVSVETMEVFLNCGFDLHLPRKMDSISFPHHMVNRGYSPIHIAARFVATTAIRFLTQHSADYNLKTNDGQSPLRIMMQRLDACLYIDISPLEALLRAGSNARERFDDKMGSTALHLAMCFRSFNEPLCALLAAHGAHVSAVNDIGSTPLKYWASHIDRHMIRHKGVLDDLRGGRWLLRHGASLSELWNVRCGRTYMEGIACICREWMRVLACGWGEDDKLKLQDASYAFERRQEEWFHAYKVKYPNGYIPRKPYSPCEIPEVLCQRVLLDWLVEKPLDEDPQNQITCSRPAPAS
ncbi:hypothetical protein MMC15_008227 [Xylographa vitiligo]|nr:hypothetical protein [Xylographa vitiligo]